MQEAELQVQRMLVAVLERYAEADRHARAAHDPDLCGLDEPGFAARCPGCRTGHYCQQRDEAAAEFVRLSMELGDLLLCLLRHCLKRRADALRGLLMDLLAPDVATLVDRILAQRNGHARRP